jgi:hypothetical protein
MQNMARQCSEVGDGRKLEPHVEKDHILSQKAEGEGRLQPLTRSTKGFPENCLKLPMT